MTALRPKILTGRLLNQLVSKRVQPDRLNGTYAALADPTRRAILARLAAGEASVTELAEPFRMVRTCGCDGGDGRFAPSQCLGDLESLVVLRVTADPGATGVRTWVRRVQRVGSHSDALKKQETCGFQALRCDGWARTANPESRPVASEISGGAPRISIREGRTQKNLTRSIGYVLILTSASQKPPLLNCKALTRTNRCAPLRSETARLEPGRAVCTRSASMARTICCDGRAVNIYMLKCR